LLLFTYLTDKCNLERILLYVFIYYPSFFHSLNLSKYVYLKISLFIEFYLVDNHEKSILISFCGNLRQIRLAKGLTQE
jgi:hypothetical protein